MTAAGTSIAVRVERGAALLDKKRPGWWKRISLDELDITSCFRCVLGQEYQPEVPPEASTPYDAARDALGLSPAVSAELGFDPRFGDNWKVSARALTEAWRELITARREAAGGSGG